MKKLIKKILSEITQSQLLNEQTQNVVNVLDANNECWAPVLRTCTEDEFQQPYTGQHQCRIYTLRCLSNNQHQPYQIGDCFTWDGNEKVECVVGFDQSARVRVMGRDPKPCVDCGQDNNQNGIDDCIDCTNMIWQNPVGYECDPVIGTCSAMPVSGPGSYNPGNPAPNTYPDILTCQANCIPVPPAGCTDSTACNYDSNAQVDDGSCTYPGCQDPNAINNGYQCNGTQGNVGCPGNCCVPITYDCVQGFCTSVSTGQGQFNSEADCLTSEQCGKYRCKPNPKNKWGTHGTHSCKQCQPSMFVNGSWNTNCKYNNSSCDNECGPSLADNPLTIDKQDCSWYDSLTQGQQIEFCLACAGGAAYTNSQMLQGQQGQCKCCDDPRPQSFGWDCIAGYICMQDMFHQDKFGNVTKPQGTVCLPVAPADWAPGRYNCEPGYILPTDPRYRTPDYPCNGTQAPCLQAKQDCEDNCEFTGHITMDDTQQDIREDITRMNRLINY